MSKRCKKHEYILYYDPLSLYREIKTSTHYKFVPNNNKLLCLAGCTIRINVFCPKTVSTVFPRILLVPFFVREKENDGVATTRKHGCITMRRDNLMSGP